MRSLHASSILCIILLFSSCQATSSPSITDEDVNAINATAQKWVDGFEAGDFELASSIFAEDAIQLPPNAPPVEGRAAIRAFAEQIPPVVEASLTPREVVGRGDLAYRMGRYTIALDLGDAAGIVADTGKFIEVWRKQADGSWLIHRDIFNSNLAASE